MCGSRAYCFHRPDLLREFESEEPDEYLIAAQPMRP
jgi:hypothetical protein